MEGNGTYKGPQEKACLKKHINCIDLKTPLHNKKYLPQPLLVHTVM